MQLDEIKKPLPMGGGAGASNGENFFALLNRHDATPDSVGKQLGIPEEVVKQWCDGNGVPDARYAIKIAEMLQCDLHELYLAILRTPG